MDYLAVWPPATGSATPVTDAASSLARWRIAAAISSGWQRLTRRRKYLGRHAARLDQVLARGEALRLAFAGSHSRGATFRNGTHLATQPMLDRFDEISKRLPEFYFGCFDIRFEDFSQVQQGQGFTILEINGAGAESAHIWDRNTSLLNAWRDLMRQNRLLFEIGALNRRRGFKPLGLAEFWRWHQREKALTPLYPATD